SDNSFILTIANRFLIFALLAIGLNVIVGYAGLLDLGYVAFYGIAGYLDAYLSSEFVRVGAVIPYGLAIPAMVSLPLIVVAVPLTGCAIGAVPLGLTVDYLASVTLRLGLILVQLLRPATRVNSPCLDRPVDLTRGPNGINNLDDISGRGFAFSSSRHFYFLFV